MTRMRACSSACRTALLAATGWLLLATGAAAQDAQSSSADTARACPVENGVGYLCGLANPEDLLRIGTTPWLLASGMAGEGVNGRLHLINIVDRRWEELFPGSAPRQVHDTTQFPDCPGPLDTSALSLHGLALQNFPAGSTRYRVYLTSHGTREAIEIFTLELAATPQMQWIGCVPLPSTVWANSVEILPDGGFLATNFMDPSPSGAGFQAVLAGERNGQVLEWHPGMGLDLRTVPGTALSGPNGIAVSPDGRYLFVTAFGGSALVRYELGSSAQFRVEISLGVVPDNLRWSSDGTLYTAGGNIDGACFDAAGAPCGPGWSVLEIDPATLAVRRLSGLPAGSAMPTASTALAVDAEIWTGTPRGDLIAILPKP